mmetsp:Transcript_94633/g.263256  ORF Transcript_94633/g.263256 Transcript_94633/m.263256 type:complete len:208 (+) Transcript_94633:111-734(+)
MRSLLLGFLGLVAVRAYTNTVIVDAEADIADLDVGDIDDWETDVPKTVVQGWQNEKKPKLKAEDLKDSADQAIVSRQRGTDMAFAMLRHETSKSLGFEGLRNLAVRWKTLLQTGGVPTDCYPMGEKILFVTASSDFTVRVKEFVLAQEETDWFEFQGQKYLPEGRQAPFMDFRERMLQDGIDPETGKALGHKKRKEGKNVRAQATVA